MKKITITIKPNYKETKEERLARVQNDTANRSNIYANKKAYSRKCKHRPQYSI